MLITNFDNRDKGKYLKAVKEYKRRTGNNDIYIDNNAYVNGVKLSDSCALRCKSFDNVNIFYKIEEELDLIGKDIKCVNKKTKQEIFGSIDSLIYNDNGTTIGYMVTNCCNEYDLYVEDFILFDEWYVRKNY